MVTQEDVAQEYPVPTNMEQGMYYQEMCAEIAAARNALAQYEGVTDVTLPPALPEREYKKIVYVKVKGKAKMEVHSYVNSVDEDNATIIANVRKDMKEAKIDVENVFVVEKR